MKTEKTNVAPARVAAFDILWRVAAEDAFASSLLASPRYDRLSREDHALAQELSLGVLRWRIQLDFLIERYARRPLDRLDQEVVIALRLYGKSTLANKLYELNKQTIGNDPARLKPGQVLRLP